MITATLEKGGDIMDFAEKIIMLRKQKGWSQEELATQLDISQPMLKEETPNTSAYENTYTELNCEKQSACEIGRASCRERV